MLRDIDPTSDTLVLAGDLCEARHAKAEWLQLLGAKYRQVYYVLGNHEFYGGSLISYRNEPYSILSSICPENVILLDGDEHCDFAGSTLWFPEDHTGRIFERQMSDFHAIANFRDWVYSEHATSLRFFTEAETPVWITHHLPLHASVHAKYENSPLNRYFVGDLSGVLAGKLSECMPQVIVHGHTHEPCDYYAGDVRVVCNPLGYPGEGQDVIIPKKVSYNAQLV
jgi:predicted phosphodiesterase